MKIDKVPAAPTYNITGLTPSQYDSILVALNFVVEPTNTPYWPEECRAESDRLARILSNSR